MLPSASLVADASRVTIAPFCEVHSTLVLVLLASTLGGWFTSTPVSVTSTLTLPEPSLPFEMAKVLSGPANSHTLFVQSTMTPGHTSIVLGDGYDSVRRARLPTANRADGSSSCERSQATSVEERSERDGIGGARSR